MAQIEELWGYLGTLFDDLNATDDWGQKHGADWTFADVPYHLAYCNKDIVLKGLELGAEYPADEQELLATPEDLAAWNARKFTERPVGQTAAQSVAQWQDSCDEILRLTEQMSDADLDKPFWMPLMRGWATSRAGLEFTRGHDWSEFMQLRIHMGRQEPVPSPAITKSYLGTMLQFLPMVLNQEAAAGQRFTTVMAFTDPGVGAFSIEVADGAATIKEGQAPDPDLVMTQSSTTFEKTFRGILDSGEAIQSGQVQVSDFERLATFGQLFPMG
jgi:putative sterol carrier protein